VAQQGVLDLKSVHRAAAAQPPEQSSHHEARMLTGWSDGEPGFSCPTGVKVRVNGEASLGTAQDRSSTSPGDGKADGYGPRPRPVDDPAADLVSSRRVRLRSGPLGLTLAVQLGGAWDRRLW